MMWLYLLGGLSVVATVGAGSWFDIDYHLAANISLTVAAAAVTVFTVLFGWRSTWWVNRVGKVFLVKGVTFSVFLAEIVVANWWDLDYPGRDHIRYTLYSLAAIAYTGMVVVLWKEQRRKREVVAALLDDDEDEADVEAG